VHIRYHMRHLGTEPKIDQQYSHPNFGRALRLRCLLDGTTSPRRGVRCQGWPLRSRGLDGVEVHDVRRLYCPSASRNKSAANQRIRCHDPVVITARRDFHTRPDFSHRDGLFRSEIMFVTGSRSGSAPFAAGYRSATICSPRGRHERSFSSHRQQRPRSFGHARMIAISSIGEMVGPAARNQPAPSTPADRNVYAGKQITADLLESCVRVKNVADRAGIRAGMGSNRPCSAHAQRRASPHEGVALRAMRSALHRTRRSAPGLSLPPLSPHALAMRSAR